MYCLKLWVFALTMLFSSGLLFAQDQVQYELKSINFEGNNSIPSSTLEEVIVSKQTPNWFFKFLNKISESIGRKPVYFDSTKIPQDITALTAYYTDNGFFKAKINHKAALNKDDKEAGLTYYINEGPHFTIHGLSYNGLDSIPPDIIKGLPDFNIDSAKYFTKTLIDQKRVDLINFLRNNGFMMADIPNPDVYVVMDSNYVDIKVNIITGLRYKIDTLRVEKKGPGKDLVEEPLIKKLVGIAPGDYYSNDEKQRAQVRLYRTNLFTSVLVNAITADTSGNTVPLSVTADIGELNELSPEVIINNQQNAFNLGLGANYSKKNFFGAARTFTLSGNFAIQDIYSNYKNIPQFLSPRDTTRGYLDMRASVDQPYLFNERITGRLEGYFTISKIREYRTSTYGAKVSFDFELPANVYINSLLTYYSVERSFYDFVEFYIKNQLTQKLVEDQNISKDSAAVYINALQFSTTREVTSIIGADIGANKTNSLLFPTKGYNLSLTLEEANLVPALINLLGANLNYNSQFYRVQSSVSYFPNLYNTPTDAFGIKIKAGYLQAYAGQNDVVPLNKRFTAGGSNSVRGWRARELVPIRNQDISQIISALQTNKNDIASYLIKDFPFGGKFLLEGSFETRNRLFSSFGFAAFIDWGNTWESYRNFSFKDVAVATGFGFRYYSPFAPIRVDFGLKAYDPVSKKNFFKLYENAHIWKEIFDVITIHLGIGEAF